MTPSLNQPIKFGTSALDACCPDDRWQAKMFPEDVVRWQFHIEPCIDEEGLFDSPNFEDPLDWLSLSTTFSNGLAHMGTNGARIAQIPASLLPNFWFEITVEVAHSSLNTAGSELTIQGFEEQITFSAAQGRYVFYGVSQNPIIELIHTYSEAFTGEVELDISFFDIREVNYPTAEIYRPDGTIDGILSLGSDRGEWISWSYQPSSTVIEAGGFYIRVWRGCGDEGQTIEEWFSETICMKPANDCDVMIGSCANTNLWGDDFMPLLRIPAEMIGGKSYKYDRVMQRSNNGINHLVYGSRQKQYELKIPTVPEHIRDFLYYLAMSNQIAVKIGPSQAAYILVEEPNDPQFLDGTRDFAHVTMLIEHVQNLEETLFTNQCDTTIPPYVIGDEYDRAIQDENENLINA